MRVFKEEQTFRQWWLLLILGSSLIVTAIPFFTSGVDFQANNSSFAGFILVLLIGILFWVLKLQTRIDAKGIDARFTPLRIFRKQYKWNEISQCYVRKYSPISEYGGWGIRGLGKAKAYNVSGNWGIQIITKDQQKFLIGTNKPDEARKVIKRYQEKFQKQ